MRKLMNQEHNGAVAFEYIIIVVIMAVVVFKAFDLLGGAVEDKAREVANFIRGNGTLNDLNGTTN